MLKLSCQPGQNEGVLLGMSFAMCLLHTRIAEGNCPFVPLSRQTAKRLGGIAQRERDGFEAYFDELDTEPVRRIEFGRGFEVATTLINNCFA